MIVINVSQEPQKQAPCTGPFKSHHPPQDQKDRRYQASGKVLVRQTPYSYFLANGVAWPWAVGSGSPVQSDDTGQSPLTGVLSMISSLNLAYWAAAPEDVVGCPFFHMDCLSPLS